MLERLVDEPQRRAEGNGRSARRRVQQEPGQLVVFSSDRPDRAAELVLTGPVAADRLVCLDTRPATGELVVVGSAGSLYAVVLDLPGRTASSTLKSQTSSPLACGFLGSDFNPVPDGCG